ncbi:4Fe-4S dicluster domain-containing protein [Candidatus Bathyarchaeota archaeon]|nr:4Fe-4S dicluster domain-containing protein [Candidatus Bathyarchaeota archaeon]
MVRILLRFSEKLVEQPITSQIILEHRVPINIITAHINSKGGEILAEIPDVALEKTVKAFRQKGVTVTLPKLIEVDSEKCFSCGACVALCPVGAITLADDFSVNFNKEKCVGSTCSACVDACPARAIKSVKQNNSELADNSH